MEWFKLVFCYIFTYTEAGLSGIQDHISLAVDKNGSIHIAFVGYTGSGLSSNRGVCYGFYNGSWTFTNVEMHSDPHGWLNIYTPIISLDKNGTPYICYVLKDANTFTAYLKVASRVIAGHQQLCNHFPKRAEISLIIMILK